MRAILVAVLVLALAGCGKNHILPGASGAAKEACEPHGGLVYFQSNAWREGIGGPWYNNITAVCANHETVVRFKFTSFNVTP